MIRDESDQSKWLLTREDSAAITLFCNSATWVGVPLGVISFSNMSLLRRLGPSLDVHALLFPVLSSALYEPKSGAVPIKAVLLLTSPVIPLL